MSLELALQDGRRLAARGADRWLLCDGPADAAPPRELLARNAALQPPLKLVLDAAGAPRLRAEWPLESAADAGEALPQLASLIREPAGAAVGGAELHGLAQAAGWPATQRNETLCAVALECDAAVSALLSAPAGAVRAIVEIADLKEAPAACAEAVAILLLRVAGAVRFVRPVFAEGSAWLEAAFPSLPDAAALGEGLAALSIAWQMAGREGAALARDKSLAADFLTLQPTITKETS
ncbi:MAG TPA: hypothetical protein VGO11_12265 [Chthoniobacteraceae bacterium]|jgi:hypothetical protein|nr:hypothetical protein [Chthoniobacteraceae bacterium]